ncbi:MAG: QueT transporter family protein [Lachnospiraceae bacterium]|nr:QueT transporter family protein [Lachnospiraceae bacterium]
MRNKKALFITQAAMIAAIYVVMTYFINAFNLANGAIQIRLSEALCILPIFTPAAVPGLVIGCFISNTITSGVVADMIFGTLATLIGAVGTRMLKNTKFAFTLPPVISNMIIVPLILKYAYNMGDAWWFMAITVGIGEAVSVCVVGMFLKKILWKNRSQIFKMGED